MTSGARTPPRRSAALLEEPLRDGRAFLDRLVLALALAPRPGSSRGAASPLAPLWRRRRTQRRDGGED